MQISTNFIKPEQVIRVDCNPNPWRVSLFFIEFIVSAIALSVKLFNPTLIVDIRGQLAYKRMI